MTVHCTGYGKNRDLSLKFWSTKDPGQVRVSTLMTFFFNYERCTTRPLGVRSSSRIHTLCLFRACVFLLSHTSRRRDATLRSQQTAVSLVSGRPRGYSWAAKGPASKPHTAGTAGTLPQRQLKWFGVTLRQGPQLTGGEGNSKNRAE